MRSAVRIRPAAPEIHLKSSDFGCFLLFFAAFWVNTILRFFVDHIEYHRQNEAVFPMPCREHCFSSLCDSCRSLELLPLGSDFFFHLNDQLCQFLLTFFFAVGVDITGEATAVGKPRRVPSFPEVFVDLADASGAGFAALTFVGLEGGGSRFPWCCVYILGSFRFSDPPVNFRRCGFPHLICDMGVDIECC